MPGTMIIFEGLDGSGKTTLARNLHEVLKEDTDVILTREPGGSEGAEQIRALVLGHGGDEWSPLTQLQLFYAARNDHLDKRVIPALEANKVVLCDRFEVSTYGFQVARNPELLELFKFQHNIIANRLKATGARCVYIHCEIEPEVAQGRLHRRQTSSLLDQEEPNHFDLMELKEHHRVREGYRQAREVIDPFFEHIDIDASRSEAEMLAQVRELLGV